MDTFAPRLRSRVGEDVLHRILVETPARVFAIPTQ